jgi:hypothetical protein
MVAAGRRAAAARARSTRAVPPATSSTQWLPVATTAKAMAAGMSTAKTRMPMRVVAWKTTIPTRRFQPACRLGKAAYTFVSAGGCSARYPWEYAVTVSKYSGWAKRGGATGKSAKKAKPTKPERNIAFRRSRYRAGSRR